MDDDNNAPVISTCANLGHVTIAKISFELAIYSLLLLQT